MSERREINLLALAEDTERFGDGLCALGEPIKGGNDLSVPDWEATFSGLGCLVETMGLHAVNLSERANVIARNQKTIGGVNHD